MKDVQRGFAFARGQNIVLWLFVQNLSQLRELYGEDGMNSFIGNAGVLQAFGITDPFTLNYVSNRLGSSTVPTYSKSRSNQGWSSSFGTMGKPLLSPDEVERFKPIITFADGMQCITPKQPYFMHIADALIEAGYVSDKQMAQFKKGKLPFSWSETFLQRADKRPRAF